MQLINIIKFKENEKEYLYLKENSYYIKQLNRGNINFEQFKNDMKIKYKTRATDKISSLIDNMDVITSVLDILK